MDVGCNLSRRTKQKEPAYGGFFCLEVPGEFGLNSKFDKFAGSNVIRNFPVAHPSGHQPGTLMFKIDPIDFSE